MNDPLVRLPQTTCEATPSVTSLPGSVDGATPCDSPDGPMTDLFGRVVAPVSPSRPQAPKLAAPIPAIFGRRGITSSASAALQSSLVSRLKPLLDTAGSILFRMTWNEKATPSGRSVCLLRASGHRTSGSGSGSWPSPVVGDIRAPSFEASIQHEIERRNLRGVVHLATGWPTPRLSDDNMSRMSEEASLREIARPNSGQSLALSAVLSSWTSLKAQNANGAGLHGQGGQDLQTMASWPTPCQQDGPHGGPAQGTDRLPAAAALAGFSTWGTPTAQDAKHSTLSLSEQTRNVANLRNQVHTASWATLTSRDHKDGSSIGTAPENALLGRQVWQTHGPISSGSLAETAKPGQLNPAFSRWLMGYPPAWDACAATVTRLSRKPQPPSFAPISTSKP